MLHTAGLGFLAGVDIYDCVLVINTTQAMEAFQRLRCTIGGEVSAVAGPVGVGGLIETEVHKRQAPVYTYLKSRGFYAGVQIDGTVMLERTDENERFYSERLSAQDILTGKVSHLPSEARQLLETLKSAQGDTDYDQNLLPTEPPPSDFEIDDESQTFGVPAKDDPDPYGVLQLEKEGMLIREAGTHKRASWEQFTFKPSPTSPVFETFEGRRSKDHDSLNGLLTSRNYSNAVSNSGLDSADASGRVSRASSRTYVTMADSSTQTDYIPPTPTSPLPPTPSSPVFTPLSPARSSMRSGSIHSHRPSMDEIPENHALSPEQVEESPSFVTHQKLRAGPQRSSLSKVSSPALDLAASSMPRHDRKPSQAQSGARPINVPDNDEEDGSDDLATDSAGMSDDEDEEDFSAIVEEPIVVHSVQKATAPQVINKARLVTVPKRLPPTLPERNPNRARPTSLGRLGSDVSSTGASDTDSNATSTPLTADSVNFPLASEHGSAREAIVGSSVTSTHRDPDYTDNVPGNVIGSTSSGTAEQSLEANNRNSTGFVAARLPFLRSQSPRKPTVMANDNMAWGAASSPTLRPLSSRKSLAAEDATSGRLDSASLLSESPKKSGPRRIVIPSAFDSQMTVPSRLH